MNFILKCYDKYSLFNHINLNIILKLCNYLLKLVKSYFKCIKLFSKASKDQRCQFERNLKLTC